MLPRFDRFLFSDQTKISGVPLSGRWRHVGTHGGAVSEARRVHLVPELLEAILLLVDNLENCNVSSKTLHAVLSSPLFRAKWLVRRTPRGKHPFVFCVNAKKRPHHVIFDDKVSKMMLSSAFLRPLKRYEIEELGAKLHRDSKSNLYVVLAQHGMEQCGTHTLLIGGRDQDILGACIRAGDLEGTRELVQKYRFDDVAAALAHARTLLPFDAGQYSVIQYLGRMFGGIFVNQVLISAFAVDSSKPGCFSPTNLLRNGQMVAPGCTWML
jgi:hypothetical protein